ncbi:MAG: response regulator transcription factor [Bifidobacteriaceae bacterium]|jgi:DNA-binding NarL/FixJ family response regulator|nr:response regulator transcription factor [Bifidobacteriaceae bacterium]MCI1915296.1 response regulator transcription factor [Bifidobacteriaceae bacterium]
MEGNHATISIVDNDVLVLQMLQARIPRLIPNVKIGWTALLGRKAIELSRQSGSRPDLLVVDMSLGDTTGSAVCHAIREKDPELPLLCITAFPLEQYARAAAEAGAQGIIDKTDTFQLSRAIPALLEGKCWPSDSNVDFVSAGDAHRKLLKHPQDSSHPQHRLSQTEMTILELSADGLSLVQIAEKLQIADGTVRGLAARARKKLGAQNLTQAVITWLKEQKLW